MFTPEHSQGVWARVIKNNTLFNFQSSYCPISQNSLRPNLKNIMKKPKNDFISVKILRSDFKKVKMWAVSKEKKFYEIISLLINKKYDNS